MNAIFLSTFLKKPNPLKKVIAFLYTSAVKLSFILAFGLSFNYTFAQQLPAFDNFSFTQQFQNPAAILNANYRQASTNIHLAALGYSDAPKTYYLDYIHPISFNVRSLASYQPRNLQSLENNNQAVGAYFLFDKYSYTNQLSTMISYAQKFKLEETSSISFGISAGIYSFRNDYSKLTIDNYNDEAYQANVNNEKRMSFLDINIGTLMRYKNYKLEASMRQILGDLAQFGKSEVNATVFPNYFVGASAKFAMNELITFIPSFSYTQFKSAPVIFHLATPVIIEKQWLASFHYQHNRNIGIEIGFIYRSLVASYSFHLNTNKYNVIGYTNHEIGIRYLFTPSPLDYSDFF
jgi:type IX secretion system PorP/SprF family membrane protein